MILTILAYLALPLMLAAAAAAWWDRRRTPAGLLASHLRHRAIVTLKTGEAFGGVLFSADADALILREAALLGAGDRGSNVVVDGEVLILRGDVAYLQLP